MSKTVTLYARVSSAEQARPDATSVEQQLHRGQSYADAMGWEVVERLSDDGITGSTSLADRPQGRYLLGTDSEVVIFWSMDRFTRSASKGLADIEALEARGISLVFVKEAIDTSTPSGRLFRTMLAAFAEFEREQIRDRNMSGRFGAAEKGKWATGKLPTGYRLDDDGDIVIDETEAEVIRKVFSLRVEGKSMPDIATFLNDRTGWSPRAKHDARTGHRLPLRFSAGSVRAFLTNTAYKGEPVTRHISPAKGADPTTFYYPVPALVSPVEWEKAQGRLVGRKPPEGAGEKRAVYALSGRVKHAHPDKETPTGMFGMRRRGTTRFYRCEGSRKRSHREKDCPGLGITHNKRPATAIDADWVEGSVLLWAIDNLGTPAQVVEFLESAERRLTPAVSEAEARADMEALRSRRERWLGLFTDGTIEKPELDIHLSAIAVEEAALQRILSGHETAVEERERIAVTLGQLMAMEVEDTGERDEHADEEPPRGSSEWRYLLRNEALGAATHQRPLSPWAVSEASYLVGALDLTATLSEGDDFKHPEVTLFVGHDEVHHHLGVSSCCDGTRSVRGRCRRADWP